MARSKKTAPRKKARGRRWGAWVFAFLALVACAAVLAMHISASVVHVQYAQVYLQDLPAAFEGTKLLFVSDIHLMGVNTPQRAAKLMESLAQLQPDLLLLGGDYTSQSLLEMHEEDARNAQASRRREFFEAIAAFPAPMGKYAVVGNHDVSVPGLREALAAGNITLLQNEAIRVLSGNDALTIVGLDDFSRRTQCARYGQHGRVQRLRDRALPFAGRLPRHHRLGSGRWRQMGGSGAQRAHARRPIPLAGLVAPHPLHLRGKVPFRLGGGKRPQYAREQRRGLFGGQPALGRASASALDYALPRAG